MTADEVMNLPIANITDGWRLRDGDLCLHVKCEDGVTREIVVDLPGGDRR